MIRISPSFSVLISRIELSCVLLLCGYRSLVPPSIFLHLITDLHFLCSSAVTSWLYTALQRFARICGDALRFSAPALRLRRSRTSLPDYPHHRVAAQRPFPAFSHSSSFIMMGHLCSRTRGGVSVSVIGYPSLLSRCVACMEFVSEIIVYGLFIRDN